MEFIKIDHTTSQDILIKKDDIADFLVKHLGQYGDKKEDILKCIEYVLNPNKGGLILIAAEKNSFNGIAILNKTGMSDYIPENILVYIAVHENQRGKGLGRMIMQKIIEETEGNIALHVEADNPAKKLYERLGFSNKYLEMRLTR